MGGVNVPGVIGEPSEEFMALRFIVSAGSYDYDGALEKNYKYCSEPMDYYTAKAKARSLSGYCFIEIEASGAERRAEGQTTAAVQETTTVQGICSEGHKRQNRGTSSDQE